MLNGIALLYPSINVSNSSTLRPGARRDFVFSSDFGSFPNLIIYPAYTAKNVYRNVIVGAQNQQFSASPTSLFPYKQCKVLFRVYLNIGFSVYMRH